MNWELFWAALGSLSTMAACIIAIFQPTFQKIITKKKIITSFRTDMEAFAPSAPDMVNEKMCTVSITNNGYNSIFISSVDLLVDGRYYNQLRIPDNQIINQIYYVKFPYELKIGEKIQVNFSKRALKEKMLLLNPTEPIKIVITDTGNKQIIKSTDKTVRNIID